MSRCTGHCCRVIYIPLGPDQLRHLARVVALGKPPRAEGRDAYGRATGRVVTFYSEEITKLAAMLEPMGRGARKFAGGVQYEYRCRNFDRATGDCRDYENRPVMCRDYPYGRRCTFRGCTQKCEAQEAPCRS